MENLVVYEGGKALTTSRKVAEKFGKRHADLLRAIQEMELPDNYLERNFALVEYFDLKGEKRPEYIISRDGFTLLAMGFTGKKAMQFKIDYLEAFNRMEQELKSDNWMQDALAPHVDSVNQKNNTKGVANSLYLNGGTDAIKEYHKKSTKLHAGCSISAIKEKHLLLENKSRIESGKKTIKTTPSAKEILRQRVPEIAAAMSMTDFLCKNGAKLEEVAPESLACIPMLKRLLAQGQLQGQKNLSIL